MSDGSSGSHAPALLEPEDAARANLYALVSRLFYAPADPNLLAEISQASPGAEGEGEHAGLSAAWRSLQQASRSAYPAVVRQEYETLFIGVGQAEVTPYLSAYAEPSSPDRFIVRLRQQLEAWELVRRDKAFEVEDHVSGMCDVMRWLIEAGCSLQDQKAFFSSFASPGAVPFFGAVQNAASSSFYKPVAAFAHSFFEIEREAFEME